MNRVNSQIKHPSLSTNLGATFRIMSSHPRTRIRSASVGRDKKSDLQARYWAFLFQNLRRAVDDLYITCEADDSIPAAKEVVLILENYVRDFKNLTDWLKLNWDYENTPPPNRPQSLTVMETAEVIKEVLSPEQELQVIPPLIDNLHKKNQFNSKQSCSDEQSNQAKTSENNSKSSISNPITSITTHNDSTYNGNSGKESYTSSNQIHISENKNEKTLDIKPPGDSKFTESSKSKNNVDHTKSSSTCDYTKVCISNSKPLKSSDSKGVAKLENCKNSSTQSLSVKNQTKSEELKNSKTKNEDSKTVSVSKIVPLSKSSSSDKNEDGNNRLSIKSPTATSKPEGTKVSPSISKTDDSKSCTLVSKTPRSSIITRPRTSIVKRTANTTSSPLLAVNKSLKPVFKPPSSSNGAILNPSKQTINANAPSFGSNSSVHSSSSIRSWAETVKGSQEPVTGSVDNLTGEAKVKKSASEEEYDKKVSSYNAKSRFRLPSSAASLPCLLSEEPEDDEKENKAVNNVKIKKANSFNRKPVVSKVNSSNKDKLMSSNSLGKIKQLTEESVRAHNESLNVAIARKEVAIAEAEQEEEYLVREIIETEKAELTEDTDGDTDVDKRSDSASSTNEVVSSSMTAASTNTPPISFEGLSWVEQIELEDQMESARYPGRAIQLHEKLSSPARKKEPHEAFKAHPRETNSGSSSTFKLINERLEMILDKMKKAEVKRQEHIEGIRKKAHEEDAKLKEIAFINELQAQNARIEVMAHNQTSDEKSKEAKEARAEEKRRKIELKRIKDVERLKERIRTREERIEVEQKQLRKDRIEAAREKARDREERLSTVRAAEQDMKEELQEKIALKQEIVAKRHKERLELIRTKAFELSVQRGLKDDDSSVPRLQPYDPKKKCEICSVLILNEGKYPEQKNSCFIPLKSICCVAKIWSEACVEHDSNTEYVLMSNSLILIVEILRERLDLLMPEGLVKNDDIDNDFHHLPDWPIVEPVAQSILDLLTSCLNELTPLAKRRQGDKTEWIARIQDQITYIINIGIVDQLAGYFHKVQDSIDNKPEVGEFILSTLRFLSSLISVVEEVIFPDNPTAIIEDPTCLFTSLRYTDLVGLVSMLYGILLHQDRPPRDTSDPKWVQVVLGSEGISLEFRHIASYLLWYCLAQEDQVVLLHEIIILVGYFAARHKDNQLIVKSGNQPSILQQLCILPFPYFCQPSLKRILFPSLLACCYENKENLGILAEELNWGFIEDFIKISGGKNHLVQIVLCNPLPSSPPSLQQHKKSPSHTNGNSNICAVQE
ncbi:unnamed protein product [Lepeophtheirus salmonis]|uniref:(salmon louse) hypothetical protein n=1 Tax=Lepeophtheirus salmonis TaxID=72036 RepID=A0A7R8CB28_LEPSM|nr:unnamed protein product [Lepeophtheirus salmonis]CAF2756622.1 unnamed protein product [Lepeophtheirus salmonis]